MKQLHEFEIKKMIKLATDAREKSYSPYSKFRVGACLKTTSGAYYLGCNIENAAFSPSCCAERTAMPAPIAIRVVFIGGTSVIYSISSRM